MENVAAESSQKCMKLPTNPGPNSYKRMSVNVNELNVCAIKIVPTW